MISHVLELGSSAKKVWRRRGRGDPNLTIPRLILLGCLNAVFQDISKDKGHSESPLAN